MKKAIQRRLKQLIESYGLGPENFGRQLLLFLMAQAISPPPMQLTPLLQQIKIDFQCHQLSDLCQFLTQFLPQYDNFIGELFLTVFSHPTQIEKCIDALLQFPLSNTASNTMINRLVMALAKHPDKSYKEIVIIKLKKLIAMPESEQQRHKIIKLCEKLYEWPLFTLLPLDEVYWLIQVHLPEEKDDTYLRGTTFAAKLNGQLIAKFKPSLLSYLKPYLDKIATLIITASQHKQPLNFTESPQLSAEIAKINQQIISIMLSDEFIKVIPTEIKTICKLIRTDLIYVRNVAKDKIPSYIAGIIFLRFINPSMTEYSISEEFQKKMNEIGASAETRKYCSQQIGVVLPKLIQGIANNTLKEDEGKLSPEQLAILQSAANRQAMTEFLTEVSDGSFLSIDLKKELPLVHTPIALQLTQQPLLLSPHPIASDVTLHEAIIKLLLRAWSDACIRKSLCITQNKKEDFDTASPPVVPQTLPVISLFFRQPPLLNGADVANMLSRVSKIVALMTNNYPFVRVCLSENLCELNKSIKDDMAARVKKMTHLEGSLKNLHVDHQHAVNQLEVLFGTRHKVQEQQRINSDTVTEAALNKSSEQSEKIRNELSKLIVQIEAIHHELDQLKAQQENNGIILKAIRLTLLKSELEQLAAQCLIFEAYEEAKRPSTLENIKITGLMP
jgi:hypothetical protein